MTYIPRKTTFRLSFRNKIKSKRILKHEFKQNHGWANQAQPFLKSPIFFEKDPYLKLNFPNINFVHHSLILNRNIAYTPSFNVSTENPECKKTLPKPYLLNYCSTLTKHGGFPHEENPHESKILTYEQSKSNSQTAPVSLQLTSFLNTQLFTKAKLDTLKNNFFFYTGSKRKKVFINSTRAFCPLKKQSACPAGGQPDVVLHERKYGDQVRYLLRKSSCKQQQGLVQLRTRARIPNLLFGDYGICFERHGTLTADYIETVVMEGSKLRKKGRAWLRLCCDTPVTARPVETRMGKGKGAICFWEVKVRPGQVFLEFTGISKTRIDRFIENLQKKCPMRLRLISL